MRLLNRNVPNDVENLGDVLVGFEPGTPVVFEATYGWAWMAELLQEMGFDAHLAHPVAWMANASARLKNDKIDAQTLAQLLRVDMLGEAWIAPSGPELRLLLRHRAAVVRRGAAPQLVPAIERVRRRRASPPVPLPPIVATARPESTAELTALRDEPRPKARATDLRLQGGGPDRTFPDRQPFRESPADQPGTHPSVAATAAGHSPVRLQSVLNGAPGI